MFFSPSHRRFWMWPLWLIQLATGYRSFRDNPILGSARLNRLGLHACRVSLAHRLAAWRRRGMRHYLSEADRQAYERDGFIAKPNLLPLADFAALKAELLALESPVREMLQGDTITRRLPLNAANLRRLPLTRKFVESPELQGLIRYVASFDVEPVFYVQTILNKVKPQAKPDPQTILHSDTFHPSAKAWLFLTDVAEGGGPFVYVPGSHRLTSARLAWERQRSESAAQADRLTSRGAFRIRPEELPALGLPTAQSFAVPANTLVVGDTYGFHARGPCNAPVMRIEIWAYARRTPFMPFRRMDLWRLPGLRYQHTVWFWRWMDLSEKLGVKKNPWRAAGVKRVDDPETIAGRLKV